MCSNANLKDCRCFVSDSNVNTCGVGDGDGSGMVLAF